MQQGEEGGEGRVLGHARVIRRRQTYDDVTIPIKQRLIRYSPDTCRGATLVQQLSSYFDKWFLILTSVF